MTDAPILPDPLRRPVAVAVVVAAVVFTVLAFHVAGVSSAGSLDARLAATVEPFGTAHPWVVHAGVLLGSPITVVALTVVLAVTCLLTGRRRLAVLAVVGPGVTGVSTVLLKPALGRTIEGGLAFPSGHTAGATAVGLVAAVLGINLARPRTGRALALLAAPALVVGSAVGGAMVAAEKHYPTDTVGGFCAAVVVVFGCALALDRVAARRGGEPGRHRRDLRSEAEPPHRLAE